VADGKEKAAVLAELSLILAAIFWGTNYAATKYAAGSVPPLSIVAIRFILGGLIMYGVLRILEPKSRLSAKTSSRWLDWAAWGWRSARLVLPSA
jgi:drug/metabolite transporter (DMT)-like permease